jgi:hypothetical protein
MKTKIPRKIKTETIMRPLYLWIKIHQGLTLEQLTHASKVEGFASPELIVKGIRYMCTHGWIQEHTLKGKTAVRYCTPGYTPIKQVTKARKEYYAAVIRMCRGHTDKK